MPLTDEELKRRFEYHAPNEATKELHQSIRRLTMSTAQHLNLVLPEGREKALAFTALEEMQMWCHAAIARNL